MSHQKKRSKSSWMKSNRAPSNPGHAEFGIFETTDSHMSSVKLKLPVDRWGSGKTNYDNEDLRIGIPKGSRMSRLADIAYKNVNNREAFNSGAKVIWELMAGWENHRVKGQPCRWDNNDISRVYLVAAFYRDLDRGWDGTLFPEWPEEHCLQDISNAIRAGTTPDAYITKATVQGKFTLHGALELFDTLADAIKPEDDPMFEVKPGPGFGYDAFYNSFGEAYAELKVRLAEAGRLAEFEALESQGDILGEFADTIEKLGYSAVPEQLVQDADAFLALMAEVYESVGMAPGHKSVAEMRYAKAKINLEKKLDDAFERNPVPCPPGYRSAVAAARILFRACSFTELPVVIDCWHDHILPGCPHCPPRQGYIKSAVEFALRAFRNALRMVDPIYVAGDTLALIRGATVGMPLQATINLEDLPAAEGFVFLDDDVPCISPSWAHSPVAGNCRWIAWWPSLDMDPSDGRDEIYPRIMRRDELGRGILPSRELLEEIPVGGSYVISVMSGVLGGQSPVKENDMFIPMPFGIEHISLGTPPAGNGRDITPARFLLSLWAFMRQKILVEGRAGDTADTFRERKKIQQDLHRIPSIKVIQLRRIERVGGSQGKPGSSFEYTCQWMVRGHWRLQPYKSTGETRAIFIKPYVKGPDDMPFKKPETTVFAVTR